MKLELKHITPYLPYGLKVHYDGLCDDDVEGVFTVMSSHYNDNGISILSDKFDEIDLSESFFIYLDFPVKLSLRPINSITKEEAYEFGVLLMGEADMEDKEVGIGKMVLMGSIYPTIMYQDKEDEDYSIMIQFSSTGISGIDLIPYEAYEWLFNHHFDVFRLINKGLAIEK